MNARMDTIKRLAETDPYWAAYLDGMQDAHSVGRADDRTAELVEANRLLQARLARVVDDVADRSEFEPVDEVRARLHARRLARNDDPTDYDSEWTRTATDREHAMARRLGLPYPARLDTEHR